MTIVEFIEQRLAEDEWWAREASRHHDEPLVEDGEHWRWECDEHDEVIEPDPLTQEFLECPQDDSVFRFSLRSVEQYPYRSMTGEGPSIHLSTEETPSAAAGHVMRHDPARVLAQVAAMRAIVEFHESWPVLVESEPQFSDTTDDIGNMTLKMAKQVAWLTEQEYRARFGDEPPTAPMLRHLATIWAGHDDYDPAWAPDA